ncbi:MAG: hypothetical protein JO198_07065 [Candidatus Dormibacteraeota bacterium]|nr:hypothetical protein [Candidatus Dormibacteraeota bacterium]
MVVATRTEERAFRSAGVRMPVRRAGVGLRSWQREIDTPVVLSAGLAGGLSDDVEPGTVVIASHVAVGDGDPVECDAAWTEALLAAAQRLGHTPARGGIVTLPAMATGLERAAWGARGYIAADMESGLLALRARRCAAVRVVLDATTREISARWRRPAVAALDPRNWSDALWLGRVAPAFARRAALVVAEAIR